MLDRLGYAILDSLTKTDFWKWFVKKYLSGFTTRVSGYPNFPMKDFFKIAELIDPDKFYAFVCSDYSSLGSITIREISDAKFTHAGILTCPGRVDKYKFLEIIHVRSTGVYWNHLLDLLREVDYIAIVEIPLVANGSKTAWERIMAVWNDREKYSYDFEERLHNSPYKIYCSEFVLNVCGDLCTIRPRTQTILGREVFAPDNILDIGKVVYSNHKGVVQKYLTDPN